MMLVLVLFGVLLAQGILLAVEVLIRDSSMTESAYYAFQFVEILLLTMILLKR